MPLQHEVRSFLRDMKERGWRSEVANSGHIRLTHTSGAQVTIPSTPSSSFWIRAAKGDMKRAINAQRLRNRRKQAVEVG